jgi:hypothetical protein
MGVVDGQRRHGAWGLSGLGVETAIHSRRGGLKRSYDEAQCRREMMGKS